MTNIKVVEKVGKTKDKTAIILAGVHGNEKAGVNAVNNIISKLKIKSGKVLFIHANLEAMKQNTRFIEHNLNRIFNDNLPKEIKESIEGESASELMPLLKNADFVLDLHQSNSKDSKPFIICEKNSFDLSKSLPADTVTTGWDPFYPHSSISYVESNSGKAVSIELGYILDPKGTKLAEEAIVSFLSLLGFIEGTPTITENQTQFKLKHVYKNKLNSFHKSRDFSDFEKLNEKTLMGKEGSKEIFQEKNEIMLFVRDQPELNRECFVVLEEKPLEN